MVTPAQQRQVVEVAGSAGEPGDDVVPLAPRGSDIAARKGTSAVPGDQREGLGWAGDPPEATEIEPGSARGSWAADTRRAARRVETLQSTAVDLRDQLVQCRREHNERRRERNGLRVVDRGFMDTFS